MDLIPNFLKRKTTPVESPPAPFTVEAPSKRSFGTYQAITPSRFNNQFFSTLLSANRETQGSLKALRGLSRYLAKNDVYSARYFDLLQTNVIGQQGAQLQVRITNPNTSEYIAPLNTKIEAAWDDWGASASIDGVHAFIDLEQTVIKSVAMDGECFIQLVVGPQPGNKYGFSLMLIDADLLDDQYNVAGVKNGNMIVQGKEIDAFGRVQAYHFWSRHPNDVQTNVPLVRKRVTAEQVLHIYEPDRIGQVRGTPWLTPAMFTIARLHEYLDAELLAAQHGANQLGTITTPSTDITGYTPPTNSGQDVITTDFATFVQLAPGEEMKAWDSKHPNTAFDPFVKLLLHGIASALNVGYSSLASDQGAENYSGGRIGLMTEREYYQNLQQWLIRQFHNKVYKAWLSTAIKNKSLQLPTTDPDDYSAILFRPRGFRYMNPLQEMKGYESAIRNGIMTKSQICAENGVDYREVLAERQEEQRLEAEGIKKLVEMGLGPYLTDIEVTELDKVTDTSTTAETPPTDKVTDTTQTPKEDDDNASPTVGATK